AEHEAPILGQRLQLVLQQSEGERAYNWPEKIREPAEHGHEHELAGLRPINQLGISQPHSEAEDCAANSAEDSRNDEGGQAEPVRVRAEISRLASVAAQGLKVQSEGRVHDPPHHQAGHDREAEAIVVEWPSQELDLVVAREIQPENVHARDSHAAVAAGQVV